MKPTGKIRSPSGKSKLKKSPQRLKGVQTITSMFKQQLTASASTSASKQLTGPQGSQSGADKDSDDDDDVTVTKVESKYFEKEAYADNTSSNKYECSSPFLKRRSSSRLSLKKSVSTQLLGERVKDIQKEKEKLVAVDEISPSQKENCEVKEEKSSSRGKKSLSLMKRRQSGNQTECDSVTNKKTRKLGSFLSESGSEDSTSNCDKLANATVSTSGLVSDKSAIQTCKSENSTKKQSKKASIDKKSSKNSSSSESMTLVDSSFYSSDNKNVSEVERVAFPSTSACNEPYCNDLDDNFKGKKDEEESETWRQGASKDLREVTDSQTDNIEEDLKVKYKTPYYQENFKVIMETVLGDRDYVKLFNEEDLQHITHFNDCSDSAQKLYIRLFSRKLAWLPISRIKYPEIADDLMPVLQEMADHSLLQTEENLTDLQLTLSLLSAGDLKAFAKTYHISVSNQNKSDIIQLLIKKSKQNTIGSMFKVAGTGGSSTMLNRAKKFLSGCVHLLEEPRTMFIRMLMLFSLNDTILDEDNGTGSQGQQLFQMLQVNIGKLVYPSYKVNRQTAIFADRDTFVRFSEAVSMEGEIFVKLEKKDFNGAFDVYQEARNRYNKQLQDNTIVKLDRSLPDFLRSYTSCGVYVRIMNQGVEILQRRKDYTEAVGLLEKLLSQQTYCITYRGHWWERLALNYDAHLKDPAKALCCIKKGLDDKYVRTGHRLAIYQRAEKICTAPKSKFKNQLSNFHHDKVIDSPKFYLDGKVLPDNVPGAKYRFLMATPGVEGDPDDLTFCGVEQLVLEHYLKNGYTDGLHAEGSIVSSLFKLFLWDVVYQDIPDAFHSPYQVYPLDLHSDHFYSSRRDSIDRRLETILTSSEEELHEIVSDVWEQHEGKMCGMNWERFTGVDHVKGLVSCLGGKVISGILGRYARNPRQTRGGFPDLTLWNTREKTVKICEVKGPGDRLSHKQILWLSFLLQLGVDAEVCLVKAVGTKMLKSSSFTREDSI